MIVRVFIVAVVVAVEEGRSVGGVVWGCVAEVEVGGLTFVVVGCGCLVGKNVKREGRRGLFASDVSQGSCLKTASARVELTR